MASRQKIRQTQSELITELNRIKTTSRQIVVWSERQIALKRQKEMLSIQQLSFVARQLLRFKTFVLKIRAFGFIK